VHSKYALPTNTNDKPTWKVHVHTHAHTQNTHTCTHTHTQIHTHAHAYSHTRTRTHARCAIAHIGTDLFRVHIKGRQVDLVIQPPCNTHNAINPGNLGRKKMDRQTNRPMDRQRRVTCLLVPITFCMNVIVGLSQLLGIPHCCMRGA